MDGMETSRLVEQLAAGFETLQEEYRKLFGQHQSLERKLATAREQYNELAKLCGTGAIATPPLSLSSSPNLPKHDPAEEENIAVIVESRNDGGSCDAANRVRSAMEAAHLLRQTQRTNTSEGVRIWSGPAADRQEAACPFLPSITESPLEQDFTVEGRRSQLGCPFASMANKKLSSHAASVLSRYNTRDSITGVPSTPLSSVSRVNGKDSTSRRSSRRTSFADPIKAEICGLSDHQQHKEALIVEQASPKYHIAAVEEAEKGVCPIRFMDQHSPEEVATYFEKHKHELPRSHEVCVRRYQSNEEQIRELDAKYGNLVSMIQGLGAKHKELLPQEPAENLEEDEGDEQMDKKGLERVRTWARSVSGQAGGSNDIAVPDGFGDEEDRRSHFDRPLRDIRVGESPSRPWGISVPAKYLEVAVAESETSGHRPAQPALPTSWGAELQATKTGKETTGAASAARCPFSAAAAAAATTLVQPDPIIATGHAPNRPLAESPRQHAQPSSRPQDPRPQDPRPQPAFVAAAPSTTTGKRPSDAGQRPRMLFTGPVFLGYAAEDAARILREGGWSAGA
ncbi:hypothetical protein LTS16_008891 [Friedmanniomyces endolithicus]|uniref:Uncharacterized protein n=1 Tax=Friedmanniomyces endolithicus TaxID=329885 RepID=A0A4V5N6T8_9PEZI|nr:hypothetical protein LTS09_014586 [Friedmanniomyces endolithicus]KAK0270967.1 hypothetical protein LTR35_013765 [Friedmanniomyces endolithicus]KAK0271890.1 hypothetical protein LTS00_016454 [Friedmanniomyces endolithicus]KAK0305794.1 hypothetical protein LTR01_006578 [Friedmanniomyces endolithicus]KAK0314123.1 hypothetical protein LTR82_013242 [Friedmanniomyces endolithicus]